jgi:hypothetical protein
MHRSTSTELKADEIDVDDPYNIMVIYIIE